MNTGDGFLDDIAEVFIPFFRLITSQEYKSENRIQPKPSREHVVLPKDSPMAYVLRGDDAMYQLMFRMRKRYFYQLLNPFTAKWRRRGITSHAPLVMRSEDRRQLTPKLGLALVLRYLATRTESSDACAAFGLLPSTFSKYLRHGMKILNEVLLEIPEASFQVPTRSDMEYYASVVEELSGGLVKNIWGAVDGIVLDFESSSDPIVEGNNYNGYKGKAAKKLVCAFAPDGSICGACWGDGSRGDSLVFTPIFMQLRILQVHNTDKIKLVGDSAFGHTDMCFRAVKENADSRAHLRMCRRIRNFSEIGLGSISRSMRRLQCSLPSDDETMVDLVIEVCIRLTNYRVRVAHEGQLMRMNRLYMSGRYESTSVDEDESTSVDEDESTSVDEDESTSTSVDEDESTSVDEDESTSVDEDESTSVDEDDEDV